MHQPADVPSGTRKPKPTPTILVRKDGTTAKSYGPARGCSWAPFEKGNFAAVTHGAFSPRMISAKAAELREDLFERYPWLRIAYEVSLERRTDENKPD
jgi:hypothetical protein